MGGDKADRPIVGWLYEQAELAARGRLAGAVDRQAAVERPKPRHEAQRQFLCRPGIGDVERDRRRQLIEQAYGRGDRPPDQRDLGLLHLVALRAVITVGVPGTNRRKQAGPEFDPFVNRKHCVEVGNVVDEVGRIA